MSNTPYHSSTGLRVHLQVMSLSLAKLIVCQKHSRHRLERRKCDTSCDFKQAHLVWPQAETSPMALSRKLSRDLRC